MPSRRTIGLTIILTLAVSTIAIAPAVAGHRPCHGDRFKTDHVRPAIERKHARAVIRCVFNRVAPGNTSKALYVAARESGYNDEAFNSSSAASGLYQHLRRYWDGRARMLPNRIFGPSPGVFNAQANAWAAALMVRRSGWGAWSTA